MRRYGFMVLLLLLCASLICAEGDYTLLQTKTFNLINRFEVENISNITLENVEVTVLIGPSDTSVQPLYQKKIGYRVLPGITRSHTDKLGNMYGDFSLGILRPGERRTITVEKIVQNSGITFNPDIETRTADYTEFLADPANKQYVEPSKHIESDDPAMKKETAVLDKTKPTVALAKDIFGGVNTYLTYDMDEARYAHKGALNALRTRRGVCTEFAGLFVAFCRTVGIPARVVSGYWVHRDLAMNTAFGVADDRHAWAEFYLPKVGWIPCELTKIVTMGTRRISDYRTFAGIMPGDYHVVWAYGLTEEREPNINVKYGFRLLRGTPEPQGELIRMGMVEESLKLIPDGTKPSDLPTPTAAMHTTNSRPVQAAPKDEDDDLLGLE